MALLIATRKQQKKTFFSLKTIQIPISPPTRQETINFQLILVKISHEVREIVAAIGEKTKNNGTKTSLVWLKIEFAEKLRSDSHRLVSLAAPTGPGPTRRAARSCPPPRSFRSC